MIKAKDQYLKVVEWSEEDGCYIGTAPGLILGGVHGRDEQKVFDKLCAAVDEALALLEGEGRPIPKQAIKNKYSGNIALRITPELHRTLAIKARQSGDSINKYIEDVLIQMNSGKRGKVD